MAQFIQSVNSSKVLHVAGNRTRSGANVNADPKNIPPSPSQLWHLEPTGDGSFWVKTAMSSNFVLDVEQAYNAPGARLVIHRRRFPPAPNQLFRWENDMLVSCMNSRLVVDVNGGNDKNAILWSKNGGVNQHWLLQNQY